MLRGPKGQRVPGWCWHHGVGHQGEGKAAAALQNRAKEHPQRPPRSENLFMANPLVKGVGCQWELTEQRHPAGVSPRVTQSQGLGHRRAGSDLTCYLTCFRKQQWKRADAHQNILWFQYKERAKSACAVTKRGS